MNTLIAINSNSDRLTVMGRDLHEGLEIKTPYTQWFDRMKEYGFRENTDYVLASQICETNNPKNPYTTIADHQITLEMAKEICMIQRSEKGKKYRRYFLKLEKDWNSPEKVMARALKIADKKIHMLEMKMEQNRPKVLFADAVSVSEGAILIGELAKILKGNGVNIGQNRLFEWMREKGFLMKRKGSDYNMPTQKGMEMGLFQVKRNGFHPFGRPCDYIQNNQSDRKRPAVFYQQIFVVPVSGGEGMRKCQRQACVPVRNWKSNPCRRKNWSF